MYRGSATNATMLLRVKLQGLLNKKCNNTLQPICNISIDLFGP